MTEQQCEPKLGSLEERAFAERRELLGIPKDSVRVALALSGGGIRSATFSLGVVQAIANTPLVGTGVTSFKTSMLSKFDYLSTVSGGGYFGGFLCSLFLPGRLRANALATRAADHGQAPFMRAGKNAIDWVKKDLHRIQIKLPWFKQASPADSGAPVGPDASGPLSSAPAQPPRATAPPTPTMDDAANDAVDVLSDGAPQRIRSDANYSGNRVLNAPLAWLRENGRYLLPTGSGDAIYVMALGLRNWLSVHWVIGTAILPLISILILLRAQGAQWPIYMDWERHLLATARSAYELDNRSIVDCIWWSTLTVLWSVPLLTLGLVQGTAFWLVQEGPKGRSRALNSGVVFMALIGMFFIGIASVEWGEPLFALLRGDWHLLAGDAKKHGEVVRMAVVLAVGTVALTAALGYALLVAPWYPMAANQRVLLTRWLAKTLTLSLIIVALAIIDTLGQTLYLAAFHGHGPASTLSPAALAGTLAWLGHRLAKKDSAKLPDIMRKLPLKSLAGVAGVVIFVLVGSMWAMLVHLMIWGGTSPDPDSLFGPNQSSILGWTLGAPVGLALATGLFPGFINLSSLQPFYGSRLTRAYLGASNGERFKDSDLSKRSAAEPMDSDAIRMEDYFEGGRIKTLAPLHIINVCVNKTVDPAEQLVQRDRKGQPLAVLPFGLALDGPQVVSFPEQEKWAPSSVDRPLTVGQWIGTSGAAFSTGIGRETTLGMSLLMGGANVRLGTWWPTGQGKARPLPLVPAAWSVPKWLQNGVGLLFRTQRYLSYELRASFHGTHRRWQYLSDGGHFENTGLYELLRPERKISRIFACDNGADPDYHFDDLANLIRLARIDLKVDVKVADPPTTGQLAGLFGRPQDFKSLSGKKGSAAVAAPSTVAGVTADVPVPSSPSSDGPIAVLLYATPAADRTTKTTPTPTQIVLIKPNVTAGVPADVHQYAVTHPPFPQEPTADQFFDEAQWESYRTLGYEQARRIFSADVIKALDLHQEAWGGGQRLHGETERSTD
jgi:hypothetical protein